MKYIKGSQTYKLDDLENCKINLTRDNDLKEGIWVKQADKEVVLQNQALAFLPYASWGTVFQSIYDTKSTSDSREEVDVTEICKNDFDNCILTIHPDAWDSYIKRELIDNNGNVLKLPG